MVLELKAYKCTYPDLFTDSYNMYMWEDPKQYDLIFGKNQKEAVKNTCLLDECYDYWELKRNIRTRRFPERDLYKQEKSKHLNNLTDKQISHLTHSLGVEIGDFYTKDFYRNYSVYDCKNENCDILVELGLMENWQKLGREVYSVTDKGKEAVKTLLLIHNN